MIFNLIKERVWISQDCLQLVELKMNHDRSINILKFDCILLHWKDKSPQVEIYVSHHFLFMLGKR